MGANGRQQLACAIGQQGFCDRHAQRMGLGAGAATGRVQGFQTIEAGHQPAHFQLVAGEGGVTCDWHLTPALQARVQSALGGHYGAGVRVIQSGNQALDAPVTPSAFNANHALRDRGQHLRRFECGAHALGQAQPLQAGQRQHNAVEFAARELLEPGGDVAAQVAQFKVAIKEMNFGLGRGADR
jgi:hypothetical protein